MPFRFSGVWFASCHFQKIKDLAKKNEKAIRCLIFFPFFVIGTDALKKNLIGWVHVFMQKGNFSLNVLIGCFSFPRSIKLSKRTLPHLISYCAQGHAAYQCQETPGRVHLFLPWFGCVLLVVSQILCSDQIRHGESIPTLPWCPYAPCSSLFAGPSPGPRAPCHGHRHPSSPAMLRRLSWCTSPTHKHNSSCRSCGTRSSSAKPSPPARTRRPDATAVVFPRQGPNCNLVLGIRVPYVRNQGPLSETLLLFHVCKAANL
jgi:hypothetical protein